MAGQIIERGEKHGKKCWLLRVFTGRDAKGKRRYHNQTVYGTKKQAEAVLRGLLNRVESGQALTDVTDTVGEYLDGWLGTIAVKPRTLHSYTYTVEKYIKPYVGDIPLARLKPSDVRGMVTQLKGKGLGARVIRMAVEVLRNGMKRAVIDELIPNNPARGEVTKDFLPAVPKVERPTVPTEKVAAFIEAARDNRLGAYWILLLFSGLRPEEALALKWDDFDGTAVTIARVFMDIPGKPLEVHSPKTKKSAGTVVLPKVAIDALEDHRRAQAAEALLAGEAWQDNEWIFTNEVGEPLRQDATRHHFDKLLKAAGLPKMRIYDLRHSCATLLLEDGEDLKIVSERLRHSTITLTADTYMHVTRGMQERAASRFDAMLG